MQRHEHFAPIRPGAEIRVERDARKFALEVLRVFLTIDGVVQDAVDVVENVVLGDFIPAAFTYATAPTLWRAAVLSRASARR